jgi:hypothetical protein
MDVDRKAPERHGRIRMVEFSHCLAA